MENSPGFPIGTVVRLKSGGPKMTVITQPYFPGNLIFPPQRQDGERVECIYFDSSENRFKTTEITPAALEAVFL